MNENPVRDSELEVLCVLALAVVAYAAIIYWFFARPVLAIQGMKSWTRVPCHLIEVTPQGHPGRPTGSRYGLVVRYSYEFGGRTYTSDRYSLNPPTSPDFDAVERIAAATRSARERYCYVDPSNPAQAVMVRDADADIDVRIYPHLVLLAILLAMLGASALRLVTARRSQQP